MEISTSTSSLPQPLPQLSPNVIILVISSFLLLIIIYPWIIPVTVISFLIGFNGVSHLDKFLKCSIAGGRFGSNVQVYFKKYISDQNLHKNVIKEVTEDPLRDYLEEVESEKPEVDSHNPTHSQSQSQFPIPIDLQIPSLQPSQHQLLQQEISNTLLSIPGRSSNRSSPEKTKFGDLPLKSHSVASSRRVSEDIPTSTSSFGVSHHHPSPSTIRRHSNNQTPSPSKSSASASARSTPSPSIQLCSEFSGGYKSSENRVFRVDVRVDQSFGRLFTNIINYYISPSWAPYETRRQLRLSLKQLLTKVGETFQKKLFTRKKSSGSTSTENVPAVKLLREKLVPLVLHYLDKTLTRGVPTKKWNEEDILSLTPIISNESRRHNVLKIRKFSRQIAERFLSKDDQNCKLWLELCVAVLADGVLVNVIDLGRDKLPELLEELVASYKISIPHPARSSTSVSISDEQTNQFTDPLQSDNFVDASESLSFSQPQQTHPEPEPSANALVPVAPTSLEQTLEDQPEPPKMVPFLLDSFLDPPFNLEKPDPIVSRWRPLLKDIVSETDLLYPLIQYMKHAGGQQSLVYLQGVLDDYPQEGDVYCRRVLELEYLPGFCRSSLLLETLGLSRLDVAQEVGADPYSIRRNSQGHARSASYGGPSSSSFREFLKIEQGVVEGLPLTEGSGGNHHQSVSGSASSLSGDPSGKGPGGSGATLPGAAQVEPNLAFKRRPHLEMFIAKFMKSTTKSWKQYYDPLEEEECEEGVKREGIDAKSYEEWSHPEVNSRVRIKASNSDIFDGFIDIVISLMRESPVLSPFCSGLAALLKPYLMPVVDSQLEKNLPHLLSKDLLISVVDLIADIFEENEDDEVAANTGEINTNASNNDNRNQNHNQQEDAASHHHSSSCTSCDPSFKSTIQSFLGFILEKFVLNLIDLDYFVECCKWNKEYIFLFFVDLLDVLVDEILDE